MGGVRSGWILKGVPYHPLCGCCAAQPNIAELQVQNSLNRTLRNGREARNKRSLGSARLAVLEAVGFSIGLMSGGRTRGRRPDRMAEAYPELQALLKANVIGGKTG